MLGGGAAKDVVMGDYWKAGDDRPIHLKEASALLLSLQSVASGYRDHRVDVFVDNMALQLAWQNGGCRDQELARILKRIFGLVRAFNIDLSLFYISSEENPADAPSRHLSWAEARLSPAAWQTVESLFGPHSVDLMALDENAMCRDGRPLRHFTPCPTPESAGVNVFSQNLRLEDNPYCYPPFALIGPFLAYLFETGIPGCTVVLPVMFPRPVWWPRLSAMSVARRRLGQRGEQGVIWVPTKGGFIPDAFGLKYELWVCRVRAGRQVCE